MVKAGYGVCATMSVTKRNGAPIIEYNSWFILESEFIYGDSYRSLISKNSRTTSTVISWRERGTSFLAELLRLKFGSTTYRMIDFWILHRQAIHVLSRNSLFVNTLGWDRRSVALEVHSKSSVFSKTNSLRWCSPLFASDTTI